MTDFLRTVYEGENACEVTLDWIVRNRAQNAYCVRISDPALKGATVLDSHNTDGIDTLHGVAVCCGLREGEILHASARVRLCPYYGCATAQLLGTAQCAFLHSVAND